MTRFMVEGKFEAFKKAFKEKWDKIGSEELDSMLDIKSNEEDVILGLAKLYEKTKEDMKEDFHEWLDSIEDKKDEDVEEIMDEIKDIEKPDPLKSNVEEIIEDIEDIEENIPKSEDEKK
ncbi:MAG: hypothetical protein WBH44_11925 [Proteocatella sp.]